MFKLKHKIEQLSIFLVDCTDSRAEDCLFLLSMNVFLLGNIWLCNLGSNADRGEMM